MTLVKIIPHFWEKQSHCKADRRCMHWNLQAAQNSIRRRYNQNYTFKKLANVTVCTTSSVFFFFPFSTTQHLLLSGLIQQLYTCFQQAELMTGCWMINLKISFSDVTNVPLRSVCPQAFCPTQHEWHWGNLNLEQYFCQLCAKWLHWHTDHKCWSNVTADGKQIINN